MALTKIDIIKRSIPVFKEKGYAATCMADIAGACGILKGSLYHHFTSKDVLMEDTLTYLRQYFIDKVFVIAYQQNLSFEKRLERLARKSEEQFLDGPGGCFMAMIGTETVLTQLKFNSIITGFFNDWRNAFIHLYTFVAEPKIAEKLAEKAMMLIEGAVLMMRIHNNPDYLTQVQESLMHEFKSLKPIVTNTQP
jgi:AcrR family transcriptional regulator